ncbi:DNA-directed RNA polymerase I subunit RPA43 [Pontoporia blainvillei]|uniref:DNA-directed RNA polymerase subunit n=1 Tax=Pontoporia blainvillei TaxID=48723 RepID=A0ABX0S553_PONBL|nr:DNA-directed RNA polymerase I subunit RPA43 [Pontoporia blainvillei]
MAAGCSVSPWPKAASEGPVVGPAGILPCLELPTYVVACVLVNSCYSCLVAGPHRRHIALSPRYLNRKRTGKKLMGTVNKVSSSHTGCLVHGCFNASIPKPEQMLAEQWQTLEINMGDELEFEIFRLDSDAAGVFYIRGKLNITSLQTKCSAVSEEVTETGTEEATEKPQKKKKKKKKDPEPYEVESGTTELAHFADVTMKEETDLQINNNVNGLLEEEPKKKKKASGPCFPRQ